jgi:ABC-type lipoprotein export system ATPase subunit
VDSTFMRGSQWRKWDLHVHTPASVLNNQFGNDWDSYVKLLFNTAIQREIEAIGITDYFSIEGYKKIITEYINDDNKLATLFKDELSQDENYISKIKQILLLPNIEFRLDKIVSSKKDGQQPRRLNYHVIFSNDVSIADIEENFLEDLEFSYQGTTEHGLERRKLKKCNLEALGQKLRSEHQPFNQLSDYYVGCMNAVVSESDICKIIKKDRPQLFQNKYILVLAEEYWDSVEWDGQDHNVRKNILSISDMIFSSNEKTRQWALSKDFQEEFGDNKPCIWGSDAHSPEKLFNPDQEKYCWIKADTTFEGLLQVLNEPKDRVFIGKKPEKLKTSELNKSRYIHQLDIKKISDYPLAEEWFDNSIVFNTDLVAIIGSKGSGKSALSDILGLLGNSKNEKYFSFLNFERFRKPPENLSQYFEAKLTWLDGCVDERGLSTKSELTEVEKVKYLPQKYIENVCNDLGSGFEQEINKMVFSYLPENEKLMKSSFDDLVNYLCQGIEGEIQSYKNDLEKINKKIIELEDKQSPDYIDTIKNQLKQKYIEIKNHRKMKPEEKGVPEEEQSSVENSKLKALDDKINSIDKEIGEVQAALNIVSVQITDLNLIKEKIDELCKRYEKTKDEIKEILDRHSFNISLKLDISYDIKDIEILLDSLNNNKNQMQILLEKDKEKQTEKSLCKIKEDLTNEKIKIIGEMNSAVKEYQSYLEELSIWRKRKNELIGDTNKEGSFKYYATEYRYIKQNLSKEINEAIKQREKICRDIYKLKLKKVNIYRQIYKPVMERINAMGNIQNDNLNFSVEILPDSNFSDKFLIAINQSVSSDFRGRNEGYVKLKEIVSKYYFGCEDDAINFIKDVYDRITNDKSKINKLLKDREGLYNYLYSLDYLKVEYKLKLGNRDMEQLSPGEKGILLLIFYLVLDKDNCPLIIDQPEDNLDNQSVYEKLVPFIREAKNRRQVIIVTHNPNIAVACDAEQIIYCNMNKENCKIEYETGSIENPKINEYIVNVLEGTMPAFTLRELKYKVNNDREKGK